MGQKENKKKNQKKPPTLIVKHVSSKAIYDKTRNTKKDTTLISTMELYIPLCSQFSESIAFFVALWLPAYPFMTIFPLTQISPFSHGPRFRPSSRLMICQTSE